MKQIESWKEIDHSWADVERTYSKDEIAAQQLETAIYIFLNKIDYASAITLAGAAGNILHQQLIYSDKIPILERTRLLCSDLIGWVPKRAKYLKHFGDMTGINRLKHKSKDCLDTIEIDLEQSAETAISRAVMDYMELHGATHPAVITFMNWLWKTKGESIMNEVRRAFPDKFEKK